MKSVLKEPHEVIDVAISDNPEARAVAGGQKVHAHFVEQVAQRLNLKWQVRGALDGSKSSVSFAARPSGQIDPLGARPTEVRPQARRQCMTMDAAGVTG